jgi:two-component system sensor histidine kinase DegS
MDESTADNREQIAEDPLEQFLEETQQEYETAQKELKEIEVLIQQSSSEVEKLVQRNAQIANKLRQLEANLDTVPRQDLKEAYTAAQESQMRLFMMRGQVEQLQNKEQTLRRHSEQMHRVLELSDSIALPAQSSAPATAALPGSEGSIMRIIDAQENERQHLARQMHDGPAQSLSNLILQAEICERFFDTDPVRARSELITLKMAVSSTFQKVREFIFDLRPMMLDDLGLVPTLKRYMQDWESKSSLVTNLSVMGQERRVAPHAEVTVFRVIQGLLNNVRQHAHASRVRITLDLQPDKIVATVEDDGSGFDVAEALASARQRRTLGITTMQEQVEMLGGRISFESSIGRGTRVTVEIPAQ